MRSNLIRCLCFLNSVGVLVMAAPMSSNACDRCKPCSTCLTPESPGTPFPAAEIHLPAESPIVATSQVPAHHSGHATLILNCPAESRCTIDGRVTHASGSNRQYHVTFDGDIHRCRIELRLRDNDEEATYEFDHPLDFINGQRIVLTVTQRQMTKTYDNERSRVVADLFEAGTTFRVTTDKKLEIVDPVATSQRNSTVKPSSDVAAEVDHTSPLWRTRVHQSKVLEKEIDAEKSLAKQIAEMQKRWETAVQMQKRAEDAYQIKRVEEDVAVNNSSAVRASKRLEAKLLEIDVTRAHDIATQAKAELDALKHKHQESLERVDGSKRSLELTERRIIVEHLQKQTAQDQAEQQRLRNLVERLGDQSKGAERILEKVSAVDAARTTAASQSEIDLAREFAQQLEQKLNEAQQQSEKITKRIQEQEKELKGFLDGTIHLDLP